MQIANTVALASTIRRTAGVDALATEAFDMPKFVVFFTFKGETLAAMMDRPSDRVAAVSEMTSALGGKLESSFRMAGPHDDFIIVEAPDASVAAALSLAAASSGRFAHLERAKRAREAYRPPGQ